MNWTGGRLSRHYRRTKGTLTAQQRQHFAKVQNKFRSVSQKVSPHKWSALHDVDVCTNLDDIQRPHQHSVKRIYPDVQSLLPTESHEPDNTGHLEVTKHSYKELHASSPIKRNKINRIPDDDLYSATPLPWQKNDNLETSNKTLKEGASYAEDNIVRKKQKLLHKRDWVGMSAQEPLSHQFAPHEQDYNVGKRRRLTGSHQAQYHNTERRLFRSPFIHQNLFGLTNRNINTWSPKRGEISAQDPSVRIHIGGRVVRAGANSSSLHSGSHLTTAQVHQLDQSQSSYTVSSDTMLLDNELLPHTRKSCSSSQKNPSSYLSLKSRTDPYKDRQNHARSSSPASIYHPAPLSARKSRLILSPSSTSSGSNVPQIGMSQPVVPSSQILENEMWKSWVVPAGTQESESGYYHYEKDDLGESEGLSLDPEQSILQANGKNSLALNELNEANLRTFESPFHNPSSVTGFSPQEQCHRRKDMGVQNISENPLQETDAFTCDEISPNSCPNIDAELNPVTIEDAFTPEKDSLDQIWMNFVFGTRKNETHNVQKFSTCNKDEPSRFRPPEVNQLDKRSLRTNNAYEKLGSSSSLHQGIVTTDSSHNFDSSPARFVSSSSGSMNVQADT
ncbi:hypothetical protein B7463_g4465, partial [Scytalidium lignicola]